MLLLLFIISTFIIVITISNNSKDLSDIPWSRNWSCTSNTSERKETVPRKAAKGHRGSKPYLDIEK